METKIRKKTKRPAGEKKALKVTGSKFLFGTSKSKKSSVMFCYVLCFLFCPVTTA